MFSTNFQPKNFWIFLTSAEAQEKEFVNDKTLKIPIFVSLVQLELRKIQTCSFSTF